MIYLPLGTPHELPIPKPDPVPGIIESNSPFLAPWVWDEIANGHDLFWEEHQKECPTRKKGYCDCALEQGDTLFGDWKRTWEWYIGNRAVAPRTKGARKHLVWVPNEQGPYGYAAKYLSNSYTIRVSWSNHVQHDARWCSPCYPGQASIGETGGGVSCYIFPPALHRCFECQDYDRDVVYCAKDGHMRCTDCCIRDGYVYKKETQSWIYDRNIDDVEIGLQE